MREKAVEMPKALGPDQYDYDGAIEDLKAMGAMLMALLADPARRTKTAWWMCANYGSDVMRSEHADAIRQLAAEEGPPPRGTWDQWLARIANR
jgi:hypothetical protein